MISCRCLFAVCAILSLGCRPPAEKQESKRTAASKPPTPVEGIRVAKGTLKKEVNASGVAAGIREVSVVSEARGKIRSVNFRLGQAVSKGRVLVQVDETLQRVSLERARKATASAELNLRVTQKLFNEGSASEAELTNAQTQASGAKAQLKSAQKAYDDCRITAPISGYIAQKDQSIERENFLAGGTLVTRIVDISSLEATVPVGEMEIGLLREGMRAKVRVPAVGSREFDGRVAAIAAGSDPATGSYAVEVVWRNTRDRAVKSGMSVRVTIMTESPDSAILVPASAVIEKDRRDAVFVASDGKAAIRFVTLGRAAGNNVEIVEGVGVGDILLTSGMTSLARADTIAVTLKDQDGVPR